MTKIKNGRPVAGLQLCDMCAAVVRGDGVALPDGRVFCWTCQRTGLHEAAEVEAVRRQVLEVFGKFGIVLKRPAPLKVVDAHQMAALSGIRWQPTVHHDGRPMGGYSQAANGEVLLVEAGQPKPLLSWTLAHESAHDWQAEHNPGFLLLDLEIQEGFAQWAADEMIVETDGEVNLIEFTEEEIDTLARLEHERWCQERRAAGWTLTLEPTKDLAHRRSPFLRPWDELRKEDKQYNRELARRLPAVLAKVDYEIRRVPTQPAQNAETPIEPRHQTGDVPAPA